LKSTTHIHVQWLGPLTYAEALQLKDATDYGIYQIYGSHPVYGSDVLLYIGKAAQQTFGKRLSQELWNYHNQDSSRVAVYVGRLSGYEGTPADDDWTAEISMVESLLIYSHWPAGNSSGLNVKFGENLHDIHILNWGKYRDLLPEVSGARYSNRYSSVENYTQYGTVEDLAE
jgi:hypothetical protein